MRVQIPMPELPAHNGEKQPLPVPSNPADLEEAAAREANVKQAIRAVTEGELLRELDRASAEAREEFLNSAVDRKHQPEAKNEETAAETRSEDAVSLSEKSVRYKLSPEQLKELEKAWTLEMETKLWDAFLNWKPEVSASFDQLLKELEALYQKLLSSVASHAQGEDQLVQAERLDQALSADLNRLLDSRKGGLGGFFERYGSKELIYVLKSSIFKAVTGHSLTQAKMERFWNEGRLPAGAGHADGRAGSDGHVAGGMRQQTGVIYRPAKGREVMVSRQPGEPLRGGEAERESSRHDPASRRSDRPPAAGNAARSAGVFSSSRPAYAAPGSRLYTAGDLEQAEQFVRYLEKGGNLLAVRELDGRSEELLGALTAVMAIKAQAFASCSGVSAAMGAAICASMDHMIDQYLNQMEQEMEYLMRSRPGGRQSYPPLDMREIYKVYHHFMNLYQSGRKAGEAILAGLQYALQLFRDKKEGGETIKPVRYGSDAGFFFARAEGGQMGEGREQIRRERGKMLVEQDWREFIRYLKKGSDRKLPQELLDQSPWGMLEEAPRRPMNRLEGHLGVTLLIAGGMTALLFLYLGLIR